MEIIGWKALVEYLKVCRGKIDRMIKHHGFPAPGRKKVGVVYKNTWLLSELNEWRSEPENEIKLKGRS